MTSFEKHGNLDRAFTEEDGLQLAVAVVDQWSGDYTDLMGREFNEYLNMSVK